jgi:hypothetical protein
MDVAFSKNGVPIRLTDERWFHIVENHDDVAGYYDEVLETIEDPEIILQLMPDRLRSPVIDTTETLPLRGLPKTVCADACPSCPPWFNR